MRLISAIAFLLVLLPLTILAKQMGDGSVLPFPPVPSASVAAPRPETHFWTMWKLPMFGGASSQEILAEVRECRSEYPNAYIRVIGFDNIKQCQTLSFIVHKPTNLTY